MATYKPYRRLKRLVYQETKAAIEPVDVLPRLKFVGVRQIIVDANHARISRDEYASHEQAALALINGTYARLAVRVDSGESGHKARPMQLEWARSLRDQCQAAGVAYFFKQIGGHPDKRHDLTDFPEDLRIREFPCLEGDQVTA